MFRYGLHVKLLLKKTHFFQHWTIFVVWLFEYMAPVTTVKQVPFPWKVKIDCFDRTLRSLQVSCCFK